MVLGASRRAKTAKCNARRGKRAQGVQTHPSSSREAPSDGHSGETFLGSTVKTVFGHCAGFVDVAAFVIHSCRGENDPDSDANSVNDILGPLFPTDLPRKTRRKQGETLEFHADGEFEDDVSALSANTLEEMEKLARKMAAKKAMIAPTHDPSQTLPGRQLVPPHTTQQSDRKKPSGWGFSMNRDASTADMSLGVATSSSSSTQEAYPSQDRDWRGTNGMQVFRAQVGG